MVPALLPCGWGRQLMKALFYTGPVSIYMKADCRWGPGQRRAGSSSGGRLGAGTEAVPLDV